MGKKAEVLDANVPKNIDKAAQVLRKGGLVAFPTETVYGLAADALNPAAVAKVFEAKKRPHFDPLIVHVSKPEEALSLWKETPAVASLLMKEFWPGPLTLVLPKSDKVPDIVTSGLPTVAVRMPKSEIASRLINRLGHPVAAPSANLFGYTSPTTASAVLEDLGNEIDLILDGGPTKIGIESTVLKLENDHCILLRPGGTPVEEIEKFAPVVRKSKEGAPYESPGLAQTHYAPRTPFTLMDKSYSDFMREVQRLYETCRRLDAAWPKIGLLSFNRKAETPGFEATEILSPKGDPREAAANLFQTIRKLDKMGLDLIVAEPVPEEGIGLAVMDRLKKATGGNAGLDKFFLFNP